MSDCGSAKKRAASAFVMGLALLALFTSSQEVAAQPTEPTEPTEPTRLRLYAFFATWCVPCRIELPHLERIAGTYRDQGLEVILVSQDAPSTAANVPAFLARHNIGLPWVLDKESQLVSRYNPTASVPFTVLVSADGRTEYAHPGYEPGDEQLLEEAVIAGLGRKPTTTTLQTTVSAQTVGVYRQSRFDPIAENDGLVRAGIVRLEVSSSVGEFSAQARVDGALIRDDVRQAGGGQAFREDDVTLERARIRDSFGPLTVTLGDDYASIGNGLALSLRKVDQLGVDTALRGGKISFETTRVEVTALAGITNPQNLDPLDLRVVDPPSDLITATELTLKLGTFELAPYTLYARAKDAGPGGEDAEWLIAGTSTKAAFGSIRVAAEAAGGRRTGIALRTETPLAGWASVQLSEGRHNGLVELKAYRDWSLGRPAEGLIYHEPPSLEREDQEVPANDNAIGARVRYTLAISSRLSAFANALHYRYDDDGTSAVNGSSATHGYAGIDGETKGFAWSGQAGYRFESSADGDFKLSLWHLDVDVSRPIGSLWGRTAAATFKWNHRDEEKQLFSRFAFRRGLAVGGISIAGLGAVSMLYGYSTERRDDTAPTHYPGVEIAAQLPHGGSLKLFGGRLTGGRVCVSGSCRDVPPFDGARLEIVLRY